MPVEIGAVVISMAACGLHRMARLGIDATDWAGDATDVRSGFGERRRVFRALSR